jgi:hypothetical protein
VLKQIGTTVEADLAQAPKRQSSELLASESPPEVVAIKIPSLLAGRQG